MRRALMILLPSLMLAASASAEPYLWTISNSNTDPYSNVAAPSPGVHDLYLWLICANQGAQLLEFGLETTSGQIVGFDYGPHTPIPGGVAFAGCVEAPAVVLRMIAFDEGFGVNVCFDTGGLGTLGVRDCGITPDLHPMAYVGFASTGETPCESGDCDEPVSVDGSTWGRIKNLHR